MGCSNSALVTEAVVSISGPFPSPNPNPPPSHNPTIRLPPTTINAVGGEDRFVDPEEKKKAREMIEKLWNNYDSNGDGALEASECATIQVDVMQGLLPLLEESKKRAIEAAEAKFGAAKPEQLEMLDRTYALKKEKIDHRIADLAEDPNAALDFIKKLAKDENATVIPKENFTNGMLKYIKEEVERAALKGYQTQDNAKKKRSAEP